jgi:ERF superfamily
MTKKTATATKPSEQPAPEPTRAREKWDQSWNIHRRLLEARQVLKGTQLWKSFEGSARDYDAFSIHLVARGVEDVLNGLGVVSHFSPTKWQKQGNMTVVEGLIVFTNVDNPADTHEVPTLGEGADDSDKGLGKATSYARKSGLISAMNLGIGVDNEAENQKATQPPPSAGPSMGGQPQQSSGPKPDDFIRTHPDMNGGAQAPPPAGDKTYTLQVHGLKAQACLGSQLVTRCWPIVSNAATTDSLEGWINLNREMLEQFTADNVTAATALKKIVDAKLAGLREKGL